MMKVLANVKKERKEANRRLKSNVREAKKVWRKIRHICPKGTELKVTDCSFVPKGTSSRIPKILVQMGDNTCDSGKEILEARCELHSLGSVICHRRNRKRPDEYEEEYFVFIV